MAVQRKIRNLSDGKNAYIPMYLEEYKDIRNFLDAHYIKNYGWMLDALKEENDDKAFIRKR